MQFMPFAARLVIIAFILLVSFTGSSSAQSPGLIEFSVSGKTMRGMPLISLSHELVVIGRDGWLHSINPKSPTTQIRTINQPYEPIATPDLRNQLRAEFGKSFEVLSTQNFLIVQPKGRGKRWPDMFERSHRGFIEFMSRRGVKVRKGRFPMVAIVFPDQAAMYAEFKKQEIDVSRVAGIYSNKSNRVMTHDGGHLSWIAATVRHEAAHQSAFNYGVHSRVNDTPKWISEGIGQMFEPEAMTTTSSASQRRQRANDDSLRVIAANFPGRENPDFHRAVLSLVSGDQLFDDPNTIGRAYAVSWAMMFYLAERKPQAFANILNHTASRPPFATYDRLYRITDLEKSVGMSTDEFSKQVRWFIESL